MLICGVIFCCIVSKFVCLFLLVVLFLSSFNLLTWFHFRFGVHFSHIDLSVSQLRSFHNNCFIYQTDMTSFCPSLFLLFRVGISVYFLWEKYIYFPLKLWAVPTLRFLYLCSRWFKPRSINRFWRNVIV